VGKFVIGDVVVLNFPQSNLQPGKRRPALVAAAVAGDDLILCQITSQKRSDGYSVALSNADFERGGLPLEALPGSTDYSLSSSLLFFTSPGG
jgi:mRNA interferase MazF